MASPVLVNCLSRILKTSLLPQEDAWQARQRTKRKDGWQRRLEVPTSAHCDIRFRRLLGSS